jgi:hypothetical protein
MGREVRRLRYIETASLIDRVVRDAFLLIASVPFRKSSVPVLSFTNCPEASVRIDDFRLETIFLVSKEYRWREDNVITPFFRLKGVLQPPGCSLVLENVYPRERWDSEGGILQVPGTRHSLSGWMSGVLSFRDGETGLELDVALGGDPGKRIGQFKISFPEPWCRVSRVDHSSSNFF